MAIAVAESALESQSRRRFLDRYAASVGSEGQRRKNPICHWGKKYTPHVDCHALLTLTIFLQDCENEGSVYTFSLLNLR